MFDVGDLLVGLLTFGNCVIKWPVKLCTFFTFLTFFFQNPKNTTFYVFLSCCTRFLEHWAIVTDTNKTSPAASTPHPADMRDKPAAAAAAAAAQMSARVFLTD